MIRHRLGAAEQAVQLASVTVGLMVAITPSPLAQLDLGEPRVEPEKPWQCDGSAICLRLQHGDESRVARKRFRKALRHMPESFHPTTDAAGRPVSWAEVAKCAEPLRTERCSDTRYSDFATPTNFEAPTRSNDGRGVKWEGSDPPIGTINLETLDALCEVLVEHAADANHCFFGLCTIHGWLDYFSTEELRRFWSALWSATTSSLPVPSLPLINLCPTGPTPCK